MSATKLRVFIVGSMIGWVLSAAVVLTDSLDMFYTPLWQKVLFYPGFLVGGAFYNCCRAWFLDSSSYYDALFVGALTVGLAYGVVALGLRALVARLFGHRKGGNTGSKSA